MTRLPLLVRRAIAGGIRRLLPEAGTGPSGFSLHDWTWTVEARATAIDGTVGSATIEGSGHPGYTATAAIIVEVALSTAHRDRSTARSGCLTPALAIGAHDFPKLTLPWLMHRAETSRSELGSDSWTSGFEANQPALEAVLRYAKPNGLTQTRLIPESVFE
jgi:hypothetical protein